MSISSLMKRTGGLSSRIYAAFLLTAVIPTSVAGVVGIFFSLDALKRETLLHLEQEVASRSESVSRFFGQLSGELRYIASSTALGELAQATRGGDPSESLKERIRITRDFSAFAQAYPHIYQVRYLDARGREVVRVDRREGRIYVVPEHELQDKSDRYYVQETLVLEPGDIYVSPLDLNVEGDKAEYPEKPVVRFGTPVADRSGAVRGLVVINLHAAILLDQIQHMAEARGGTAYLLDRAGFFLSRSADSDPEPGLEMKSLEDLTGTFPRELLGRILAGARGTAVLDQWIVAFAPVDMRRVGLDRGQDKTWTIALAFPSDRLFTAVFNLYLLYAVLGLSLAVTALAGFLLSRRLLRPLTLLQTQTEAIAGGNFARRVEIKGGDEIAELGRRFNFMAEELQRYYASLEMQRQHLEHEVEARTAALERERKNLSTIIENTADGILSLSQTGIIELANAAAVRLVARGTGDLVGANFANYCPTWTEYVQDGNDGIARSWLHDFRIADRILAINVTPVTRDGLCHGYIVVVRDVSEERKFQDERRELDRQIFQMEKMTTMGELAMGLAHEIGNPLAGMKTVVQVLLDEETKNTQNRVYLQRIENEVDRLSDFLRTFHGFAAPQEMHPTACRLEEVLEDVLLWTRKEAKQQEIAIKLQRLGDSAPSLWADPNQLKQVLLNLVINAIHAMKNGGRITISMRSPTNADVWRDDLPRMRFSIEDTGVGIPKDVLPRIFDPFFTTRENGSGLGLAVVKKIVVQHGADIFVESEVGKGTRFELSWPIAAAEAGAGKRRTAVTVT